MEGVSDQTVASASLLPPHGSLPQRCRITRNGYDWILWSLSANYIPKVKECLKGANRRSFSLCFGKILAPSLLETLFKMDQLESNSINALKKKLTTWSMLSSEAKKA